MKTSIFSIIYFVLVVHPLLFYGQEKLEVEGAIVVKDSEDSDPAMGTIRYNSTTGDFEGYNGQWVSLTNTSGPTSTGYVIDVDGNYYLSVEIGTQVWMRENLRTSHYNDGSPIRERVMNNVWDDNLVPGWCWYNNDPGNDEIYGKLYNWYALSPATNGNRNVCPDGWHIPNDAEWGILKAFLDPGAANKMRSIGTIEDGNGLWDSDNNSTNESGFTVVPAGRRSSDGQFSSFGSFAAFWSITDSGLTTASLHYFSFGVLLTDVGYSKKIGVSVRCIKD